MFLSVIMCVYAWVRGLIRGPISDSCCKDLEAYIFKTAGRAFTVAKIKEKPRIALTLGLWNLQGNRKKMETSELICKINYFLVIFAFMYYTSMYPITISFKLSVQGRTGELNRGSVTSEKGGLSPNTWCAYEGSGKKSS